MYLAGMALADAPTGVLSSLKPAARKVLLNLAASLYDKAHARVTGSPLSPADAHRLRSGALAMMLGVIAASKDPGLKRQAATAYLERALVEPHEGLRDTAYRNLEALRARLPAELHPKLDALKARVLPERPPAPGSTA
jgi:hypothetical protein